ncbi:MAG: hypothetical protein RMM29_06620, partial [Planctomycetota bacterium]|nr:hypothetical protein [Planctomycetota bacterium]
ERRPLSKHGLRRDLMYSLSGAFDGQGWPDANAPLDHPGAVPLSIIPASLAAGRHPQDKARHASVPIAALAAFWSRQVTHQGIG